MNMKIEIDETMPEYMRNEMFSLSDLCPVCGGPLFVLPVIWFVFEHWTEPSDFFIHPRCLKELKKSKWARDKHNGKATA